MFLIFLTEFYHLSAYVSTAPKLPASVPKFITAVRVAMVAACVMLRKQKRAEGKEVLSPFPRLGDI